MSCNAVGSAAGPWGGAAWKVRTLLPGEGAWGARSAQTADAAHSLAGGDLVGVPVL